MSSILNKVFKSALALTLALAMCVSLTACTKNTENIKDIDQIGLSGALYESWLYNSADEEFIAEMVDIYNSLKFEKSVETVDMMTAGDTLQFTFYADAEQVAEFIVDKNNMCCFEAGAQSYKIVSDFDFEHVKELVQEQTESITNDIKDAQKKQEELEEMQ